MLLTNNLATSETNQKTDILTMFKTKEVDKDWSFAECKPSDTGKWTHNYHRYPAKFIPQLVEKLLDEYIHIQDAHINDPFMGSGTTIVSAISRGFKASGTDVNKIAYLITKVKSTPIEPSYLSKKIEHFMSSLNRHITPFIPEKHIDKISYWFTEESIVQLGKILKSIYNEENEIIRDFFLVAFSHILKTCSLWSQKSTKPTRDLNRNPANPYDVFYKHVKKMQVGNEKFYKIVPDKVKKNINNYLDIKIGDARQQPVANNSVDLVITSSPYVTSYEYVDLHQLSLAWLDLVDNLKECKKEFIGTASKHCVNKTLTSSIALDIVNHLSNKDKTTAKEVEAFFIDMEEVFKESWRILKHGGRCCYVIGNTTLKGVDILNAEVFAESLQCIGFKLDKIIKREIPSKILPQKRDAKTGRFTKTDKADTEAYPVEYIIIGLKE